jgi:hypothetical protein
VNFRKSHLRIVAATVGLATAVTLGLGASPASAKVSDGWVRGYDAYANDWDDEGELSNLSPWASSNATCLWQRILWAEGASATNYDGKIFAVSHINGVFNYRTQYTTIDLQKRWGLSGDGIVGSNTFKRAAKQLSHVSGSTSPGKTLTLRYQGKAHSFEVPRNAEGKYLFRDGDNGWRQAGYKYRTCS